MVLSIDKFGRVLIPKKVRTALNLHPGATLTLEFSENSRRAYIEAERTEEPALVVDEYGIPTFVFDSQEVMKYDFVDAIRTDREQRGLQAPEE